MLLKYKLHKENLYAVEETINIGFSMMHAALFPASMNLAL